MTIQEKPTREENEHLVSGVIIVSYQHGEVCPSGATLAGFVSKLTLELIKSLVQLILGHQIASIVAQLISTERSHKY